MKEIIHLAIFLSVFTATMSHVNAFLYDEDDHAAYCDLIREELVIEANRERDRDNRRVGRLIEYMTVADCWRDGDIMRDLMKAPDRG